MCFILLNKRNKINVQYKLDGHAVESVQSHTYLGVEMTESLSWDKHINNISIKARKQLNMIRHNFGKASTEIKKQAYTSLGRPILEYAASVWDPFEEKHIGKLEGIQNAAARFIKNDYRFKASVSTMKHDLELQTLQERRFIARNVQLFKAIKGDYAIDILPQYGNPLQKFIHMSSRIDSYKYSFLPRTVRCWHIIPLEVRAAETPEQFRDQLTSILKKGDIRLTSPRGVYNRPLLGSRPSNEVNYVY